MPGTAEGAKKARMKKLGTDEADQVVVVTDTEIDGQEKIIVEEVERDDAKRAADERVAARYGTRARAFDPSGSYVVGFRPLKVGHETLQPGDPIDVSGFPRLESWLNTGRIRRAG